MTPERARLQAKMHEAYEEIANEREPRCQGCPSWNFERSHSIPKDYDNYRFIAEKENIVLLCRQCHVNYENGKVFLLDCGEEIMNYLAKADEAFYNRKVAQMVKRLEEYQKKNWLAISNGTIFIPTWALNIYNNWI